MLRLQSDLFLLIEQNPLSKLKSLEVWHEKKGDCKPWLLHSVYIIEHMHHILYQFPCHKWLGDNPDDLVIFSFTKIFSIILFGTRIKKGFTSERFL